MTTYYLALTSHGAAAIAAAEAGTPFTFAQLVVGDASGQPYLPASATSRTQLVHQCAAVPVQSVTVVGAQVQVKATLPGSIGGFNLHEIGLTDTTGQLVYIGNWHGGYKPQLTEGAASDMELTLILDTSGLPEVVIELDPTSVLATRQWALDRFVLQTVHDEHVTQDELEHANLLTATMAVNSDLQDHKTVSNPHPQYAYLSDLKPRHLFQLSHLNMSQPYAISFGYASGGVTHTLEGINQSLIDCLFTFDVLEQQGMSTYVVEGISMGLGLNKQGYLLKFDGYIQFGSYAGQGDTSFATPTARLKFRDESGTDLTEVTLTLSAPTGGFPNNGTVGHVTYRASTDFSLVALRKPDGSVPSNLQAALHVDGLSDSDGGSTDLQILTIEQFCIVCSY